MSTRTAYPHTRALPTGRRLAPTLTPACVPGHPEPRPWTVGGRGPWPGWIGIVLLGAGLILSGTVAIVIAATRVVLPYDEAFAGASRGELAAIDFRLLPFMAHDRVALAGTLIAIGILYTQLAAWGIRRGLRWARTAALLSGTAGFASFLLCLGFGYFDPAHALGTLCLLPFFLLGWWGRAPAVAAASASEPPYNRRWRLGRSGRGLFVLVGAGLTVAGLVIAVVGTTTVFVPEDLAFMRTTAGALQAANAHLLPLIAHDRAGFGGALASNGLAVLLIAAGGFRRGARWLWWTLLGAGVPGFGAAIGVHVAVGYLDAGHLAPAFAGLALYILALALSAPYLLAPPCYNASGHK